MLLKEAELAELRHELAGIEFFKCHHLCWLEKTLSTNDDLKTAWKNSCFVQQVEVAELQTAGRGQYQRQWHGRPGQCLMFSFSAVVTPGSFAPSLIAGAALVDALTSLGPRHDDLWLKWPNDLWFAESKLAGILTESCLIDGQLHCVIGIGINMTPLAENGINSACVADFADQISYSALLLQFCSSWNRLWQKSEDQLCSIWSECAGNFWKTSFLVNLPGLPEFIAVPEKINSDGSLMVKKTTGSQQQIVSATLKPVFFSAANSL